MRKTLLGCFVLIFVLTLAATAPATAQNQNGVEVLLGKARSLEARDRMDLAAQNWKQVLLVNPNQPEALAGLARYAKQNGDNDALRTYLDRLRKVNPKDPAIAAIEKMHILSPQERNRLDEAGRLAMQHKPDEAMKIYRLVFGDQPPSGKWAEAYYETEAASTGGREKAIVQLRRLCARDPKNEVSRLWLARVLSYDPKTRMEGFRLFESIKDPGTVEQARTTWRQALLWEKENPEILDPLDAYLKHYPDAELQQIQASLTEKREHAIEEANKKSGFEALNGKNLTAAEAKFNDVLRRSPNDTNAITGLAFVRLNQKRFDDALSLFERARQLAPQRADIRDGYETAKLWSSMQQGSTALQQNRPEVAIAAYQEALTMQPSNQQALLGTAQAFVREKRYSDAEAKFQQVLAQDPNNADAVAGLGFIRLNQKQFEEAATLFAKARTLSPNRPDVDEGYRTAKFWALMKQGANELAQDHSDVAIASYQQALTVKPGDKDALLGLAQAATKKGNYSQATQAYTQLTTADPNDTQSWLGLIKSHLAAKNPKAALDAANRIPPAARQQLEKRADYLAEMAFVYYRTNQASAGELALRRALDAAGGSDSEEALAARLEVASVLMDQGDVDRAVLIYKQAAVSQPKNPVPWQGMVGAYLRKKDLAQAKAAIRSMPQSSFDAASKDSGFLSSVAAIYSAEGECSEAEDLLNRSLSLDKAAGREPSESTRLQLADIWRREGNYDRAVEAYREIANRDQNSIEAWRGYITALHSKRDDETVLAVEQRSPAPVRARLEKDPGILVLLASTQSRLGQHHEAVRSLKQAQAAYQAEGKLSPADLDVQLAWAMLADSQNIEDPRDFLAKTKMRKDLTPKQRSTIDEIWSTWSIRRAEEVLQSKEPARAVAILTETQSMLPNDTKIPAALASVYVRQHDYQKALGVYQSWGMSGAEAADYRAAAGAALVAHKDTVAEGFLREGLQRFPNDPELLRMNAKRAVAHGNYDQAEYQLKSALSAMRTPDAEDRTRGGSGARVAPQGEDSEKSGSVSNPMIGPATSDTVAGCRTKGGENAREAGEAKVKPIAAVWIEDADSSDVSDAQQPQAEPKKEQQVQDEIDIVQNRNTPFFNIDELASGRTGDLGFNRLIIQDGAVGTSGAISDRVRLGFEAHGVYLFSGAPSGSSSLQLGTLPQGALFGEQSTAGYGGEVQLSTNTFGLMFGTTPQGFPVRNLTGGARFRPLNGPVTFLFVRDSVKDSLLSYAGLRDPGTGIVWGGVMSNSGSVQFRRAARRNGQYLMVRYSDIRGRNVADNTAIDGNAGFYFGVVQRALVTFTVGANVGGMHYDKNLNFFTLGQGGYFSPQQYYQASLPISVRGRHNRLEYEFDGSGGVQYFQQDRSPFFPVNVGVTLPPQSFYNSQTHTGPNYSAALRLNYRAGPHVNFGFFAVANNSRNFATQSVGFSIKFLIHRLPTNPDLQVNSIPDWRGDQPFRLE